MAVLVALGFGLVPLCLFWPLLANLRAYYGPHIWGHYSLASIPVTYGSFFYVGGALGMGVVAVCIGGIAIARFGIGASWFSASRNDRNDAVEGILLLTLLAFPCLVFIVTRISHGAMAHHYVLAAILGIVLSLACVMSLAHRRMITLFAVFVFSIICFHELSFWRSAHSFHLDNPATPIEVFVSQARYPELPVVVSSGHEYLELAYYASPEWKTGSFFYWTRREQCSIREQTAWTRIL